MAILVTGGAGYIGSHTCVELLNAGYDVIVVDNLCNSSRGSLTRVEKITGKKVKFYEADIRSHNALEEIFGAEKIDAVIHFAGLKAVGESVYKPLEYYHNNVTGTVVLCDVMRKHDVKILFSALLRQSTEYRKRCRSAKIFRSRPQARTVGQSWYWRKFCGICTFPTMSGM